MLANIKDLDKMPDDAAFHHNLHYLLRKNVSEDNRKYHIHTADQPKSPWGRAKEHRQSQFTRKTIKVKQTAFSSSADY